VIKNAAASKYLIYWKHWPGLLLWVPSDRGLLCQFIKSLPIWNTPCDCDGFA